MSTDTKSPFAVRSSDSSDDYGFFGIIFGRPGVGKTSLLANRKKSFFIGNEINKEFYDKKIMVGLNPCNDWEEFIGQLDQIKNNIAPFLKKYDTIVVDNFSDIERLMIKDFAGDDNLQTWNGGYGKGTAECEKRSSNLILNYFKFLQQNGLNVVLVCHCDERTTEDLITGNSQVEYVPSLNKATLKPLEAHASFIFHVHIPTVKGGSSDTRVVFTSPTLASKATKKKMYIDLPDKIEINKDPSKTWLVMHDKLIYKKEVKKEEVKKEEVKKETKQPTTKENKK